MTTTPTLRDAAQALLRYHLDIVDSLSREEFGSDAEIAKHCAPEVQALFAALAAPADALAEPVVPDADSEDPGLFRHFDGMCWPVPGEFSAELEWRARHSHVALSMGDRVCLASIVSAYTYLISLPAKGRDKIIRELRKGPQLPPAAAAIRAKGQQT